MDAILGVQAFGCEALRVRKLENMLSLTADERRDLKTLKGCLKTQRKHWIQPLERRLHWARKQEARERAKGSSDDRTRWHDEVMSAAKLS
jgi:hypothetical protein